MKKTFAMGLLALHLCALNLQAMTLSLSACAIRIQARLAPPLDRKVYRLPYAGGNSWLHTFTGYTGFYFPGLAEPLGNFAEVLYQPHEGQSFYARGPIVASFPVALQVFDETTKTVVTVNVGQGEMLDIYIRPTLMDWHLALRADDLKKRERRRATHGTYVAFSWYWRSFPQKPMIRALCPIWENGNLRWEQIDSQGHVERLENKAPRRFLYAPLDADAEQELLGFWQMTRDEVESLKHACHKRHLGLHFN